MRQIVIFSLAFVLCAFSAFGRVESAAAETIKVVCEEWPNYTNKDGTGAYWEVVKAVFEPLGIKVETNVFPWKRAVWMVANKEADALVGDYYDQAKDGKEFLYPKWHISIEDPIVAVLKKADVGAWQSKKLKSLAGKKIGWIRGYDFNKSLLKGIKVSKYEVKDYDTLVKMMNAGRLEAILGYEAEIASAEKKNNIDLKQNFAFKTAKMGNKLFLVFANTAQSKKLIEKFDKQMAKLAKNNEIAEIYTKWNIGGDKKFGKDRFGDK